LNVEIVNMAKSLKKLTPEVLGVLSRLVVEQGPMCWVARITDGQLDRKVYVAFNEAVETLGGSWNKKVKGHLFDHDPSEEIEALLLTGEFKTKFAGDFFQTPVELAKRMVAWAVRAGDLVLEPSAGLGRIAAEAKAITPQVYCYEQDPARAAKLIVAGFCTQGGDFLQKMPEATYDAVVMNPPFSKGQETRHILHAMKFLRPGGRLAAVASAGVTFRETALYKELREALAIGGKIEELPAGTFSKEGTDVSTVLITWTKS
jgi:predicted RNA methylase